MNDSNWVDSDELIHHSLSQSSKSKVSYSQLKSPKFQQTLAMVETAFLASTSSLIWLINTYFPLGIILRLFFPIPIAILCLRWGNRSAWIGWLVSGLLLTVLMGPIQSILFITNYGLIGIQLGACWRRNISWKWSIFIGAVISIFSFFFKFWLFSILTGEDLWQYSINQMTILADWLFLKFGTLIQPSFLLVQVFTCLLIFINSIIYLFAVHIMALMLLDKLGSPITRPPKWVQIILDY